MSKYRTAQGKMVDMSALMAQNERTRAVGNMKVNARGDTIDDHGRIIVPVTQKVGEKYQKTVGNKSAQVKKPIASAPQTKKPIVEEELTLEEKELLEQDDIDIEEIKAQEKKK